MRRSAGFWAAVALFVPLSRSAAVDMAVYDFTGCDGTQESTSASWVVCDRVCASTITRGGFPVAPVQPDGLSWPGSMSANGWSGLGYIPAVPSPSEPVTYFEFSLTPVKCEALDLDKLTFGEWGEKHAPTNFTVRCSFDGFTTYTELLTGSTSIRDDPDQAPPSPITPWT